MANGKGASGERSGVEAALYELLALLAVEMMALCISWIPFPRIAIRNADGHARRG
jgi:hypothetical protein